MTGQQVPLGCRDVEQSLGVLVLGSLDPVERPAVDSHLAGCPRCTATLAELAPLPGLLHRLTYAEVAASPAPHPPDDLRRRLVDAARRDERRRRRGRALVTGLVATAAVVALVAAAVAGVPALVGRSEQVTVSATDPRTHVRADVRLREVDTGTELSLRLAGVPPGERCRLVAVGTGGRRDVAATWVATYAGRAEVTGQTGIARERIARLVVVSGSGRTLVELPVPA